MVATWCGLWVVGFVWLLLLLLCVCVCVLLVVSLVDFFNGFASWLGGGMVVVVVVASWCLVG